jgi:hypothetical protein
VTIAFFATDSPSFAPRVIRPLSKCAGHAAMFLSADARFELDYAGAWGRGLLPLVPAWPVLEGFMRLLVVLMAMLFASAASAADGWASGDTIRFQHSFRFTDFAHQ